MNSGSFNTSGYQGRYLLFTWALTSQNFDTNSSVISWTLAGAGDALSEWYESGSFKVVINGITVYASSARIQLYNGTIVANGELTITHNGDGSKTFSASAEGAIGAVLVNSTGSGSWELPKISREATLTDAPNFTDEQNPTIEYINPSGSYASSLQACISLNEIDDLITWRDIPKNGTRYTFELTEIERNSLRASSITSNILPVTFILKTIIEGETYYSKISRNMVIVNADPVFSGATYEDVNPVTLEITEDDQQIIEGLSSVSFTLSNLSALKSSVLSSVSITINGVVVTAPVSGTTLLSKVVSFGVVDASDDLEAIVTLIDSRGNTGTISVPLSILSYSAPSAIISCNRDNNYETDTELLVNAAYSSLDSKNELTIEYQYKEIDGSTWSALTEISNNTPETISLDNTKAWNLRVILTDLISSTTYNLAVERGLPLVFYDRKRRSVGVNCFPSADEVLEVNGVNVFINPDWTETDPTSPAYIRNKPSTPLTQVQADWTESDPSDPSYIKNKPTLGTAAALDVPASGDASSSEVVLGSDTRLSDSRAVTFTEAQTRTNIASGEGLNTLFGKIKKFFTDLKAVAFSGSYNDLTDKPTIPDPSNFVTKTGTETISGLKTFTADIDVKNEYAQGSKDINFLSFFNSQDTPTTSNHFESVNFMSKNRDILGKISNNVDTSGDTTTEITARGYDTSRVQSAENYLKLKANRDGTHSVDVNHPEDWRAALNLASVASSGDYNDLSNKPTIPVGSDYVLKAGDTMTGDLRIDTTSSTYDTSDGAGVSWKETNYGDKFEIRPCFAGSGESNFLAIKTAIGGQGTDPNTEDKIRIFPSGNLAILGQTVNVKSPTSYINNQSSTIDLKQNNNGISSGALYPAFLISDSNGYIMSRFESAVSSDGSVSTYMYAHNMNGTTDAGLAGIKVTRKKDSSTIWQVDGQKEFRSAINTNTCSITRHSSAPSNIPLAVITRKGNLCIFRISHQFPNVTQNYYKMFNVTPKPNTSYYGTLFIGSTPTMAYVNSSGEVCFNNTMSVPAGNWVIGQIVYLTDD